MLGDRNSVFEMEMLSIDVIPLTFTCLISLACDDDSRVPSHGLNEYTSSCQDGV